MGNTGLGGLLGLAVGAVIVSDVLHHAFPHHVRRRLYLNRKKKRRYY